MGKVGTRATPLFHKSDCLLAINGLCLFACACSEGVQGFPQEGACGRKSAAEEIVAAIVMYPNEVRVDARCPFECCLREAMRADEPAHLWQRKMSVQELVGDLAKRDLLSLIRLHA